MKKMLYDIDFWDYYATREKDEDFKFRYYSKTFIDYYYCYDGKMLKENKMWFIKDTINDSNGPLVRIIPRKKLIIKNTKQLFVLIRNKSYGFYSLEHFNKFKIQAAYWQT